MYIISFGCLISFSLIIVAFTMIIAPFAAPASSEPPLIIGIDADMSDGSARAGLAIQHGAEIAITEINVRGGVLDRPLELLVLDHRGNPTRGTENIKKLAKVKNLIGVLAGLHMSVALPIRGTVTPDNLGEPVDP